MADLSAPCAVTIRGLSGNVVAHVVPIPATVAELKSAIETQCGTPSALQQLLKDNSPLLDDAQIMSDEPFEVLLCVDQTPLFSWDLDGNPAADHISVEGGHLRASRLRTDFVNVVAKEPVRHGIHFFEFVVHRVQDEQWCGVVHDKSQAGKSVHGSNLDGRFYYFNKERRGSGLRESYGKTMCRFDSPQDGDVIGMLLNVDTRMLVFALNGKLQGKCVVPGHGPLYFFTTVDRPGDHMELRKPLSSEAPEDMMQAA
eukprot:TRINITY_DN89808_c0_g1_i1.p1 TRINITY_DN89808_c0_g1~~TRINITY_DN89808_c0_g1_i1.p1  ORF type:complete len:256 (-),score=54.03 TRINITY_DN89808_c0_g1_i1:102-869(-)